MLPSSSSSSPPSPLNQCGRLSLPIVCFYISGRASAERRPAEIPFSLISSDRAPGTPREPGQLAGPFFFRLVTAACLALGPEFAPPPFPPHNPGAPGFIEPCTFMSAAKCHRLASDHSTCSTRRCAIMALRNNNNKYKKSSTGKLETRVFLKETPPRRGKESFCFVVSRF